MQQRLSLFIFFVFCGIMAGFGQQNLRRVIVNSTTKQPVDYVYVSSNNNKINLLSNNEGKIILITEKNIRYFTFYKMGYFEKRMTVEQLLASDTIFLYQKTQSLQEVTVTPRKIDTIVRDKRFYVNDYLALDNGFLILTSKINIKGFELSYYIKDRGITCTKKFKNETGEFLFTDCLGNIHLVTNENSRQLFFESDSLFNLLPKYSRAKFDSTLAICALKTDTQIIIRSSMPPMKLQTSVFDSYRNSPFLTYISVSHNKRRFFHSVVYNSKIREMMKYEMSDWAMIATNAVLLGGKPPSEEMMQSSMNLFFTKIAAPIYAPIYLKNDTVIIFNFQENKIVFLDKSGSVLQEIDIHEKGYSQLHDYQIIYDEPKQKFYIKSREFDKELLNHVNIYTGEISKKIKLEKIFAKNIQVLNNRIFYLVKEKEWDDTSYLYEQNL